MTSTVNLYGRKSSESAVEFFSQLNSGEKGVTLRSYGGAVPKGIEIAQLICQSFDGEIKRTELNNFRIEDVEIPNLDLEVSIPSDSSLFEKFNHQNLTTDFSREKKQFISYLTYSLLADWYLHQKGGLNIYYREKGKAYPLLKVYGRSEDGIKGIQFHPDFKKARQDKKINVSPALDKLNTSLIRAGVLQPDHWKEIGKKLSQHDDVIIGLDTNVLYNCSVTEHLVPALLLMQNESFVSWPNWILLAVPSIVMHELERQANIRDKGSKLNDRSRAAYRALQEIMELKRNTDINGLTLVTVGKIEAAHDLLSDVTDMRHGIQRMANIERHLRSSSRVNSTTRQQFNEFLQKLDFHKGTYFLSSDKTNAALAMVESLDPIYLSLPFNRSLGNQKGDFSLFTVENEGEGDNLVFDVPIGAILYELAVSFGEVALGFGKGNEVKVTLECDSKGDSLHPWVNKQLLVNEESLKNLLEDYKGRVNLENANDFFKSITERYEGEDWLFQRESPWTFD